MRSGGQPLRFTAAGRALLAGGVGAVLLGVVVGAPLAVALGAVALALLVFDLASTRDRARRLARLSVRVELLGRRGAVRGHPLPMTLHISRAEHGRALPVRLRVRITGEPRPLTELALRIPGGARAEVPLAPIFDVAGHWAVHGLELTVAGLFGLAVIDLYRPEEHGLTVTPARPRPDASTPMRVPPASEPRQVGEAHTRRPGEGGDLLELRDYVPGDPVRAIAWKATARRGRPLVRQTEEARQHRVHLLLAIGPTMRSGPHGRTALDRAVDHCDAELTGARTAQVGLTTFDHRIYGHLDADQGPVHVQRLRRHLLDLRRVVDDDLTEIAMGELLTKVGQFFERQLRVPMRRPGALDPRHLRSTVDPLAEQFDPGRLYEAVTAWLAEARDPAHAALHAKSRPARDTFEARLRLFCALRSIPLPYRLTGPADAAEQGLRAAVARLMRAPVSDEVRLYTDLSGLSADGVGLRALRGLAVKRPRLVVATSEAPTPEVARALGALRAQQIRF